MSAVIVGDEVRYTVSHLKWIMAPPNDPMWRFIGRVIEISDWALVKWSHEDEPRHARIDIIERTDTPFVSGGSSEMDLMYDYVFGLSSGSGKRRRDGGG